MPMYFYTNLLIPHKSHKKCIHCAFFLPKLVMHIYKSYKKHATPMFPKEPQFNQMLLWCDKFLVDYSGA